MGQFRGWTYIWKRRFSYLFPLVWYLCENSFWLVNSVHRSSLLARAVDIVNSDSEEKRISSRVQSICQSCTLWNVIPSCWAFCWNSHVSELRLLTACVYILPTMVIKNKDLFSKLCIICGLFISILYMDRNSNWFIATLVRQKINHPCIYQDFSF